MIDLILASYIVDQEIGQLGAKILSCTVPFLIFFSCIHYVDHVRKEKLLLGKMAFSWLVLCGNMRCNQIYLKLFRSICISKN